MGVGSRVSKDFEQSLFRVFFHIQSFLLAFFARGRVDEFSFFNCSSPFCFLLI